MNFGYWLVVLFSVSSCIGEEPVEYAEATEEITNAPLSSSGPESVMIEFKASHFCSGLAISKHWIVTAGHCTYAASGKTVRITTRRSDGTDVYVYGFGSARFYTHPDFVPETRDYNDDLGLIRLEGAGMSEFTAARIYTNLPPIWDSNTEAVSIWGWGIGSDSNAHITCAQGEAGAAPGETIKTKRRAVLSTRSDSTTLRARMNQGTDLQGEKIELCGGDSGAPVFLSMDGLQYAFATYTGNPMGIAEGPSIGAKIAWIVVTSTNTVSPLTCRNYTSNNGSTFRRCYEF